MLEIDAIILAAGRSRRMGANKLLLPFQGTSVIELLLRVIPRERFHEVVLLTNDDNVANCADGHGIKTIGVQPERGKSHSIQTGLEASKARDGVMFFVGDQPRLKESTIVQLLRTFEDNPKCIIVPSVAGERKNPVIFPSRFRELLFTLHGDQGGRDIFRTQEEALLEVKFEHSQEFEDIDTPERYKTMVEQCRTGR